MRTIDSESKITLLSASSFSVFLRGQILPYYRTPSPKEITHGSRVLRNNSEVCHDHIFIPYVLNWNLDFFCSFKALRLYRRNAKNFE